MTSAATVSMTRARYLSAAAERIRETAYNLGYRIGGATDGYPLPPARLVRLVIGSGQLAWYQLGGMYSHQAIVRLLRTHGVPVEAFTRILDFGVGCGRLLRYWGGLRHTCEIWGTDCNRDLIEWCRRKLSFAKFTVNDADPPLEFPSAMFDFVYSYSVFTHLSAERQQPWLRELSRVLRPGGYMLITVHGVNLAMRNSLPPAAIDQMNRGELVVVSSELSGTNVCAAFHSEPYIRQHLAQGLEVIEYFPRGMPDGTEQDIYLFRKPAE